jgi:DNA-binding response OmpR family regulator
VTTPTPLRTEAVSELRHDLRTPVNLIVGYAEMLGEDLAREDPRQAHLIEILAAARDVLDRINAALPASPAGATVELRQLLTDLTVPQTRVLAATTALRAGATAGDPAAFSADVQKIADAAARLTQVRQPVDVGRYTAEPGVGAGATARVETRATERPARILVVDDLADNRAVLERRLARRHHQVVTAASGEAALRLLREQPFDLVLLDVLMPDVDGFEVLERMKSSAATRDIPVIMISALDDLSSVVRCIEHGAEDYLAKPFDPVLLAARIGAALEKKRFRDREAEYLAEVARVIEAAGAVERGEYDADSLRDVSRRDDELGRLARVFDSMVAGVRAREDRLHDQLRRLRDDVAIVTRDGAAGDVAMVTDELLVPGSLLAGRYEISNVLGRGGMGTVYGARDRELGEQIALKLVRPELLGADEGAVARFKNEIRLARRISHRNVVRTHDLGECDGAYFVTMEYVRGITVRELLDRHTRLGTSSTLALTRQLVEALAVAHDAGIVHRDVKPENALLDDDGVLKVMDFGIARLAQDNSNRTQAGMVLGTPTYMAPEQLLGETVDGRSDLYAVGVVMYECLTGGPPFTAASPIALIGRVLSVTPTPVAAVNPDIPPAVSHLIDQLLGKSADERPASARILLEQLAALG